MWLEPQKMCIPVYCDSSIQRVPRDVVGVILRLWNLKVPMQLVPITEFESCSGEV
jgi:hypothetical protein